MKATGVMERVKPLDFSRLKVFPLAERVSLTSADDILLDPDAVPPTCSERNAALICKVASEIRPDAESGAAVMLIYGAHLLRNGAREFSNA